MYSHNIGIHQLAMGRVCGKEGNCIFSFILQAADKTLVVLFLSETEPLAFLGSHIKCLGYKIRNFTFLFICW